MTVTTSPKQKAGCGSFLGVSFSVVSNLSFQSPPLMAPPCIWTFAKMKEFKEQAGQGEEQPSGGEAGEVVTIRVPTHPEGKSVSAGSLRQ